MAIKTSRVWRARGARRIDGQGPKSCLAAMRKASLAALVAVPAAYLFADRPVSTMVHGWHHPAVAVSLTDIADAPLPLAALVLLGAGLAALAGWRPGARMRVLLAAAIVTLLARAAADELKLAFGRPWPETWVHDNPSWIRDHVFGFFPFHGGPGYASFPSGHTVDITAPCAVLWRYLPRLRTVAALLVAAVASGLVAADYHFVSDVLAGLYVGTVVAYGLTALIAA